MPHHTLLHRLELTGMTFNEMMVELAEWNMSANGGAGVIMLWYLAYGPGNRGGVRGALRELGEWAQPIVPHWDINALDRNAGLVASAGVLIGLGAWIGRARRSIRARARDRRDYAAAQDSLVAVLAGNNTAGVDLLNGLFFALAIAISRRFGGRRF